MNRWTALISVAALFFSGVAIGALGLQFLHTRQPGRPAEGPPPPPVFVSQFNTALDLTADQKRQIAKILEDSRKESEAIRLEVRPRIERQIAETRKKIDAVLTAEQRQKLAALHHDQRAPADRFFLGEGAGGPWFGPPMKPRGPHGGPPPDGPPPDGPPPGGPHGDGPPPDGPPPEGGPGEKPPAGPSSAP